MKELNIFSELLRKNFNHNLVEIEYKNLFNNAIYLTPKVGKIDLDSGLYLIISGKIRLLDSKQQQIITLDANESFGQYSLFSNDNFYPYEVRASIGVQLYFITRPNIETIFNHHPEIKEYLWQKAKYIESLIISTSILNIKQVENEWETSQKIPNKEGHKLNFPSPTRRLQQWWQGAIRRYPLFLQQSTSDCGVACLVTIANYWGKRVSINRLREIANVGRDGASMKGLITASESLEFSTRSGKATLEGLEKQHLPAIAHWEGNHFVVVWEITKTKVIIGDPAIGQQILNRPHFTRQWTGYVLLLEPTLKFNQIEENKNSLWQFVELVKPHWFVLLEIFLASLFIQIFGLITPIFTQIILDRVIIQGSTVTLFAMGLGLIIFGIFGVAITGLRTYLLDHTANRIDVALITGFIRHTLSLPLSYFDSRYVGDIISRVEENRKIQRFLSGEALSILLDFLTIFIYLSVMFKYSWKLALLALIVVPPFFFLALIYTPFLQRISREIFKKVAKESSYLIEILTGIRTVKSTATEQSVRGHWEELLGEAVKKRFSGEIIGNQMQIISNLIETLATTGLLWFGAYLVIENQLTIGQLIAFNMLFANIISPFQRLTILWNEFQEVNIAVERLNDVFQVEPEENLQLQSYQSIPIIHGNICFDKVTFRYHPENQKNTLENLSFEIPSGQTIALVGRSGSGKTTIAKLLLGLYTPNQGKILIDGYDIATLSLKSVRQQIGIVDQDSFLFGASIRANISLDNPSINLGDVIESAKLAGIHEFIKSLPMGYETHIGEGGGLLSGGQRQRIAIARALINNPKILILDEATSHLDTESEQIIQTNLNTIRQNRTIFIIAHRLSTIRNSDMILVLDKGVLIESGNHEELMVKSGLYYHLNHQQVP